MFLIKDVSPRDFIMGSLPCEEAVLSVHCPKKSKPIQYIQNNDIGIINEYFDKNRCIRENIFGFFNLKYGLRYNIQNAVFSAMPRFSGFKQHHLPSPLLKSICEEVWERDKSLAETCERRFRTAYDVNQWLFWEWAIVKKQFFPYAVHKLGISFSFDYFEHPDQAVCKLDEV